MKPARAGQGNACYFLANRSCFFHRYADSGFRTKWTGLWHGERKFLEYFALKVNGEWLSPCNLNRAAYDFSKAVHYYKTASGEVRETVFIPEDADAVVVEVECAKEMEVELKLAVNIRHLPENYHERQYHVSGEGHVTVANDIGSVTLLHLCGEHKFSPEGQYENHSPSGEAQRCFIPGGISYKGRRVAFALCIGDARVSGYRKMLAAKEEACMKTGSGLINSDCAILDDSFVCAALDLELLRKHNIYYAGLPWFQQSWGRDTFWSLPALINIGCHSEARELLEYFGKQSDDGRIPNFISSCTGKSYNSIDATLLWLIGLEYYVKSSGDVQFLKEIEECLTDALGFLSIREKGSFIRHDHLEHETWMDTQKRGHMAVEIQALYYRALRSVSYLMSLLGKNENAQQAREKAQRLQAVFDPEFFLDGFYADRIDTSGPVRRKTANAIVPVFMELGRRGGEILDVIESGIFMSDKGIRTLASDEQGFDPAGYHNGAAWSLTTAWAAAAEFMHGRTEKAWELMRKLMDDMNSDALSCIGECWNSESSELTGCPLQLWGAAWLIRLVDEFMLGIEVDAPNRTIKVSPRLPAGIGKLERVRLVGKDKVLLRFEKTISGIQVSCSNPEINLIKVQ